MEAKKCGKLRATWVLAAALAALPLWADAGTETATGTTAAISDTLPDKSGKPMPDPAGGRLPADGQEKAPSGRTSNGVPEKGSAPKIQADIKKTEADGLRANQDSRARRAELAQRANEVFTLYAGELALLEGMNHQALGAYVGVMGKSRDPLVAERTLEIALQNGSRVQAEAVWRMWQELAPDDDSPATRRMRWQLALADGDTENILSGLDDALSHADTFTVRRIFLQMAQLSLNHPEIAAQAYPIIHSHAAELPQQPEAAIADALFASAAGKQQDAVSALRRLVDLDERILPVTQLTIKLIYARQPQILQAFFKQSDIRTLPPMWQSLYISSLMATQNPAEAYRQVRELLSAGHSSASADLYVQAGFLSASQNAPLEETLAYLEQAYAVGDGWQQSRAALIAAVRLTEQHKTAEARLWAGKIRDKRLAFDKAVLLASLSGEEGRWAAAQQQLDAAQKLSAQSGMFFDENDWWRVQSLLLSRTAETSPKNVLARLNRWLAQAQKQKNNDMLVRLLYQRGLLYADTFRQPEKAVADFRRVYALEPDNVQSLNSLGYTLLFTDKKHWQEAQQLLEQAYQLNSQSPAVNDSLGWAYVLNGDAERALPYLTFAFQSEPEAEVAAHLGAAWWRLGRKNDALVLWQKIHQKDAKSARLLRDALRQAGITLPAGWYRQTPNGADESALQAAQPDNQPADRKIQEVQP